MEKKNRIAALFVCILPPPMFSAVRLQPANVSIPFFHRRPAISLLEYCTSGMGWGRKRLVQISRKEGEEACEL
jgi:hypothetical protein